MCEPAHSITQYDQNNDDHWGGTVDTGRVLDKLGNWAKKIGRWFHISKMGAGHSAATGHGCRQLLYLPESVKYEGFWWNKGQFELDGCRQSVNTEQFDAAKEYHKRSCIGSMQISRRFFEMSMQKSNRPWSYIELFMNQVLTKKGKDLLYGKLKRVTPNWSRIDKNDKSKIIKVTMGFTRKRGLLVPEWSMDDEFWSGRRAER